MAAVRIEDEAFSDERYDDLAHFAGLADADHARGKMARLWRQCTIENTHELETHVALRILGSNGVIALVRARLGELIRPNSDDSDVQKIRIKGTEGRIEWLDNLRKNGKYGKLGGRPRKTLEGLQPKTLKGGQTKTPLALVLAPALSSSTNVEDPRAFELAGRLLDRIVTSNPGTQLAARCAKGARDGIAHGWTKAIVALHADGIAYEDIGPVIDWCQDSSYWKAIVLSSTKLRKQWDQLVAQKNRDEVPAQRRNTNPIGTGRFEPTASTDYSDPFAKRAPDPWED